MSTHDPIPYELTEYRSLSSRQRAGPSLLRVLDPYQLTDQELGMVLDAMIDGMIWLNAGEPEDFASFVARSRGP